MLINTLTILGALALATALHAAVMVAADIYAAGQCPSGFPSGGLFTDCAARDWLVAATFDPFLDNGNVSFVEDFKSAPPLLGLQAAAELNSSACSVRLGPGTTIYQELTDLPRARMYVQACARAWGNAGCHVEVRDNHNRVVDHLEFAGAACAGSNSGPNAPCTQFCEGGWKSIAIKYVGELATNITISAEDDPTRSISGAISYGGVIELAARNNSYLPSRLVVQTERFGLTDLLDLSCNSSSTSSSAVILPGQFFGDHKQFLIDRGTTGPSDAEGEQIICPFTDAADDRDLCKCHADDAEEVCKGSVQGFIPEPELVYYIGLVARECTCDFDSACLHILSEADYLGVKWNGRVRVSNPLSNPSSGNARVNQPSEPDLFGNF